jgi:hypothetical protein
LRRWNFDLRDPLQAILDAARGVVLALGFHIVRDPRQVPLAEGHDAVPGLPRERGSRRLRAPGLGRRQDLHHETVPVGTHSVAYTIKAKRGTQFSDWSEALTLRFGRAGGGLTITSSETTPADAGMKMAA